MKNKKNLLYGTFTLFIVTFFLPVVVASNVISIGLLVLVALNHNSLKEKLDLFGKRKHIWLMLAFVAMLLLSFTLSDNQTAGLSSLRLRIPLLLFPISIGLLSISKEFRNKVLLTLAIITTIACFLCLCVAIYRYRQENNSAWLYNDALSLLIRQQSIYTSLFVNISIYVFGYFILFSTHSSNKKLLYSFAIIFLFVISYLLASRNMMLILYSTVILFAFFYILQKKKYLEGVTLLMAILIGGFMVFKFFPKTLNRFKELAYTQFNYKSQAKESHYADNLTADQWNGANFRLAAWQCGWQLFKEHPIKGVDLGDKKDALFTVYKQKGFQFAIDSKKNVHNNYLDILYSMGIIGCLLFLAGWFIFPFLQFIRTKDGLATIILLTFFVAMITENYFDRSLGAMVFAFFIPFLLSADKKRAEQE
jgi:O-antigen ligase